MPIKSIDLHEKKKVGRFCLLNQFLECINEISGKLFWNN